MPINIHAKAAPVSPWIERLTMLAAPGGHALDVAAGEGRHTGFLLDRGFEVTAIDRKVEELSAHFGNHAHCRIMVLDLENGEPWRLGGGFDLILVSLYLHRPLFPDLIAALAPGGVLIYETFMRGNEKFGRPTNPDFLLQPNELFERCSALNIVAFEQGEVETPKPAMMQRIAAVAGAWPKVPR